MESEKKQYVVFRTGTDEYGADICSVTIIEKIMNITRVPATPPYIKGVINLRGDIIPVMDLRIRLGLPEKEPDDDTRIVILTVNSISFGIIVDMVLEVLQLDVTQIDSAAGIINDMTLDYISGVARAGERLITLINLEKLISELIPA